MGMKKTILTSALALSLTLPVLANGVPISPGLPEWQELTFKNITPNRWREDGGAVVAESSNAASILYQRVSVSLASTPMLRWRWRVDQATPATDLARKGVDDRPLALTIGFAYDSANASMGERMKRVIVERVAGADAPGRVVDLTWGGSRPVGTLLPDPHAGESGRQLIVRESGEGDWQEQSVDVAALYRRIWGAEPPPVTQIGILVDSDDTDTTARSAISDIRFTAQ